MPPSPTNRTQPIPPVPRTHPPPNRHWDYHYSRAPSDVDLRCDWIHRNAPPQWSDPLRNFSPFPWTYRSHSRRYPQSSNIAGNWPVLGSIRSTFVPIAWNGIFGRPPTDYRRCFGWFWFRPYNRIRSHLAVRLLLCPRFGKSSFAFPVARLGRSPQSSRLHRIESVDEPKSC